MTTLDELRRANMQEQRRNAQTNPAPAAAPEAAGSATQVGAPESVAAIPAVAPEATVTAPAPTIALPAKPVRLKDIPPTRERVSVAESPAKPVEEQLVLTPPLMVSSDPVVPVVPAPTVSIEFEAPVVPTSNVPPASTVAAPAPLAPIASVETEMDPQTAKARKMLDRFYRSMQRRVIHPTGVKATVDMPPDLFWRIKRYCHDHNNITLRQLFLDLVMAMLDEEGY